MLLSQSRSFIAWGRIGIVLIVFAFFITMNWQSCYVKAVTGKKCDNSMVYLESEDGIVYYLWSKVFTNLGVLRIMTYVVTPMTLAFIGTFLITEDVTITPFRGRILKI